MMYIHKITSSIFKQPIHWQTFLEFFGRFHVNSSNGHDAKTLTGAGTMRLNHGCWWLDKPIQLSESWSYDFSAKGLKDDDRWARLGYFFPQLGDPGEISQGFLVIAFCASRISHPSRRTPASLQVRPLRGPSWRIRPRCGAFGWMICFWRNAEVCRSYVCPPWKRESIGSVTWIRGQLEFKAHL